MKTQSFVKITSPSRGLISKDCSTPESIGIDAHPDHPDEVSLVNSEFLTVLAGNSITQRTLTITKQLDLLGPFFMASLESGEEFDCTITTYIPSSAGPSTKFCVIEIKGASTADISTFVSVNERYATQEINLRFREISLKYIISPNWKTSPLAADEQQQMLFNPEKFNEALLENIKAD